MSRSNKNGLIKQDQSQIYPEYTQIDIDRSYIHIHIYLHKLFSSFLNIPSTEFVNVAKHKSYRIITSPLIYISFVLPTLIRPIESILVQKRMLVSRCVMIARIDWRWKKKRRKKRIEEDGKIRVSRLVRSLGGVHYPQKGNKKRGRERRERAKRT